jgi:hypothetical protein
MKVHSRDLPRMRDGFIDRPFGLRIAKMQRQRRAALRGRVRQQHHERGGEFFHRAREAESGGQGNPADERFSNVAQIDGDQPEPAVLHEDVASFECLLHGFHATTAASHPQQAREADPRLRRGLGIEAVRSIHQRAEFLISGDLRQQRQAEAKSCRMSSRQARISASTRFWEFPGLSNVCRGDKIRRTTLVDGQSAGNAPFEFGFDKGGGRHERLRFVVYSLRERCGRSAASVSLEFVVMTAK